RRADRMDLRAQAARPRFLPSRHPCLEGRGLPNLPWARRPDGANGENRDTFDGLVPRLPPQSRRPTERAGLSIFNGRHHIDLAIKPDVDSIELRRGRQPRRLFVMSPMTKNNGSARPGGPRLWRSLEDLADTPEARRFIEAEFPYINEARTDRRTILR